MDTTKVDDLIRQIQVPSNIAVTVVFETMLILHCNDYVGVVNYITARCSEINTSSIRSAGSTCQISKTRNEFNGINICDPFQSLTLMNGTILG